MKISRDNSPQSKRLVEFRKHLKLSQGEFAAETGFTQGSISHFEVGRDLIPERLVKYLHDVHNMSYTWFYNGTGPKIVDVTKPIISSNIAQLHSRLDDLEALSKKNAIQISLLSQFTKIVEKTPDNEIIDILLNATEKVNYDSKAISTEIDEIKSANENLINQSPVKY